MSEIMRSIYVSRLSGQSASLDVLDIIDSRMTAAQTWSTWYMENHLEPPYSAYAASFPEYSRN